MNQESGRDLKSLVTLTVGALGVVYGDIGTSPLYGLRQCFLGTPGLPVIDENIFGVLSLIFWALVFVVSIKYLMFVMNADNNGEGGVMALVALAFPKVGTKSYSTGALLILGLFGAALLFGDGMITPAISVLSAVEGLTVAAPTFQPLVIPITIALLILLFIPQKYGTARVGRTFGPIILSWFAVLAILGVYNLVQNPIILKSINPYYAFDFLKRNGWNGFLILGTVFLVVTGGEALYADMGHFGKKPIRLGWFCIAFPALLLNYFGQGALLLGNPSAVDNPFFKLAPEAMLYPTIAIATLATITASQAMISGVFSLTHQAVQLGYLPRLQIIHTNEVEKGQIYVPTINWFLLLATVFLVIFFENSGNLAGAYGIAITCTMVITTVLVSLVAHRKWAWGKFPLFIFTSFFIFVDGSFLIANIHKIPHGGWFPLVVAAGILLIMMTWKRGRKILFQKLTERVIPLDKFLAELKVGNTQRIEGTAIFLTSVAEGVPPSLTHNAKHNRILHNTTVLINVSVEEVPRIPWSERYRVKNFGHGIYSLHIKYGFMDSPNIPIVLMRCRGEGLKFDLSEVTYFLGRETLVASKQPAMPGWQTLLFETISRNAQRATDFFKLPPEQVFEIGTQVEL